MAIPKDMREPVSLQETANALLLDELQSFMVELIPYLPVMKVSIMSSLRDVENIPEMMSPSVFKRQFQELHL